MVFWQLTVDSADPEALAAFWKAALGYQSEPPMEPDTPWHRLYRSRLRGRPEYVDRIFDPDGLRPPLWFQQVPEEKAGKNRLHIDLYPTQRDATLLPPEIRRIVDSKLDELVGLGATVLRRHEDFADPADPVYFVNLQDPEGNEFCVS